MHFCNVSRSNYIVINYTYHSWIRFITGQLKTLCLTRQRFRSSSWVEHGTRVLYSMPGTKSCWISNLPWRFPWYTLESVISSWFWKLRMEIHSVVSRLTTFQPCVCCLYIPPTMTMVKVIQESRQEMGWSWWSCFKTSGFYSSMLLDLSPCTCITSLYFTWIYAMFNVNNIDTCKYIYIYIYKYHIKILKPDGGSHLLHITHRTN